MPVSSRTRWRRCEDAISYICDLAPQRRIEGEDPKILESVLPRDTAKEMLKLIARHTGVPIAQLHRRLADAYRERRKARCQELGHYADFYWPKDEADEEGPDG